MRSVTIHSVMQQQRFKSSFDMFSNNSIWGDAEVFNSNQQQPAFVPDTPLALDILVGGPLQNNNHLVFSTSPSSSTSSNEQLPTNSRLHSWMDPLSPAPPASPPTLMTLFRDEWDPAFTQEMEFTQFNAVPMSHLPNATNDFSVSNYTIELIVAEGAKYGYAAAAEMIEDILKDIPQFNHAEYKRMLIQRAKSLVRKRQTLPLCAFCRNNGEKPGTFMSHVLKDEFGRVQCPILRAYTCPRCQKNGDYAHTLKYCPKLSEEEKLLANLSQYTPRRHR